MRLFWKLAAGALCLALASCDYDYYEIEMTPEGDSCSRQITCWKTDTEHPEKVERLSDEELAKLAKTYPERRSKEDSPKQTLAGKFKGTFQNGLPGVGTYIRFSSELGDLCIYSERFGGSDDQASAIARTEYCADQLSEIATLWAEHELKKDPRLPRLTKFLREDFRQDLKNVSLYLWTGQMSSPASNAHAVRAAQYLLERGYFKPEELPLLFRIFCDSQQDSRERLMSFIQRQVAVRMGVKADEPLPETLQFLSTPERARKAFEEFRKTNEYKNWLKQLNNAMLPGSHTEDQTFEAMDKSDSLLPTLAFYCLGDTLTIGAKDRVSQRLKCATKPIETNGQWQEAEKSITWSESFEREEKLPALLYASWAQPNEEFQKERFGSVIVRDSGLMGYVLWHNGLSEDEAKEWTAFLKSLKPGKDLIPAVEAFRFRSDAPKKKEEDVPGLAEVPLNIILQALKAKKDAK